jgi:hypothetical protein
VELVSVFVEVRVRVCLFVYMLMYFIYFFVGCARKNINTALTPFQIVN